MKRNIFFTFLPLLMLSFFLPAFCLARDIAPIVSTDWLSANLKNPKLIILDVRRVEDYREGHIPGAELTAVVEAAAGKNRSAAIVTYCDIGQCCPTWSFLLTEVLGYTNVRLYEGAMQEWAQDADAPVTTNDKTPKADK